MSDAVQKARRIYELLFLAALMFFAYGAFAGEQLQRIILDSVSDVRMLNVEYSSLYCAPSATPLVEVISLSAEPEPIAAAAGEKLFPAMEESLSPFEAPPEKIMTEEQIKETTIKGGLSIKNETSYVIDPMKLIAAGPSLSLPQGLAQILIIHTHSSEAYTQSGLDRYEASDENRTENTEYNIVRIGDELTSILQNAGLGVIHDRGIYDYPSYTGSYTRSGEAISQYLSDYPSIKIVIDIHRDALGSDGVVYKTMAEEDGVCASQIMLLVGTDESGLEHPNWKGNLSLALYLQAAVNSSNPTLMRPVDIVPQRYNQHLSPGSLIMEVGSSGNTLQEALAAVRLFGNAVAQALLALVEQT